MVKYNREVIFTCYYLRVSFNLKSTTVVFECKKCYLGSRLLNCEALLFENGQ